MSRSRSSQVATTPHTTEESSSSRQRSAASMMPRRKNASTGAPDSSTNVPKSLNHRQQKRFSTFHATPITVPSFDIPKRSGHRQLKRPPAFRAGPVTAKTLSCSVPVSSRCTIPGCGKRFKTESSLNGDIDFSRNVRN